VNVQHDCHAAGCKPTGTIPHRQEREDTGLTRQTVVHNDDSRFIINTHALHNATLLRNFLPRYHTVPRPLYADRRKRRDELGQELAQNETARRAEISRKTAETKKRNKALRAEREQVAAAPLTEEPDNEEDENTDIESDEGMSDERPAKRKRVTAIS
jgi:hypothetical protein